jgi:hypothetical protein
MKLYTYYSIDECKDTKRIKKELNVFDREGKIEYEIDRITSVLKIEDIDLEDADIEYLVELFEDLEVYPNMDMEEDDEDGDDYGYYDDDGSDDEDY